MNSPASDSPVQEIEQSFFTDNIVGDLVVKALVISRLLMDQQQQS